MELDEFELEYIGKEFELLQVLRSNSVIEFLLKTTFLLNYVHILAWIKSAIWAVYSSLHFLCFCFFVENEIVLFLFCWTFVDGTINCVEKSPRERWTFSLMTLLFTLNWFIPPPHWIFLFVFTESMNSTKESHQVTSYLKIKGSNIMSMRLIAHI